MGARKLRGICFIDLEDTEFKETIENARKKLETSMARNSIRYRTKTILQEKEKIITALQFGSQVYSYVSSFENSGSKRSSGQGMGKIGENFGVEFDKSQK